MSYSSRRGSSDGFSFVELLVTMVILGLLAAVVVFAVWGSGQRVQAGPCADDASILSSAEKTAQAETGGYLSVSALESAGLLTKAPRHHTVQLVGSTYRLVPDGACSAA